MGNPRSHRAVWSCTSTVVLSLDVSPLTTPTHHARLSHGFIDLYYLQQNIFQQIRPQTGSTSESARCHVSLQIDVHRFGSHAWTARYSTFVACACQASNKCSPAMGIYVNQWEAIRTYVNQEEPMATYANLWESEETYANL